MSALEDALARADVEAFDRAVSALGGARALLAALLARASAEELARVDRVLARAPLDVAALAALGPVALWRSSEWMLRAIPGGPRRAPLPAHEQWDALVEIHAGRPEAAWLVIELLASLSAEQRALGRRIAIGVARRFGARGARIARARADAGECALRDLLEAL